MAYTKYSLTPANNNAAPPDGAPEGMLPSAVNDTMRDMMAQIRDCGDGIRDGTYTITNAKITGGSITGITDLAIADGGTGASTLAGASIATTGYTTTATAAGTTTLTVSSNCLQFFTGTTTQTVVLPVASTLTAGQRFEIHNNSTGNITVNSSGGNLVATVLPTYTVVFTCILTSGTTAASWDADIQGFTSLSGANIAQTNTAQSFTAAQRGSISTLTDGATITPDFSLANNYTVTLGGNRTLANPSNLTAGQSGSIFLVQDGTGGRTLAYGSQYDFIGGTAPTLSTGANAVDRIDYVVRTTGSIHCVFTANYS
jgi:hypothetical protein